MWLIYYLSRKDLYLDNCQKGLKHKTIYHRYQDHLAFKNARDKNDRILDKFDVLVKLWYFILVLSSFPYHLRGIRLVNSTVRLSNLIRTTDLILSIIRLVFIFLTLLTLHFIWHWIKESWFDNQKLLGLVIITFVLIAFKFDLTVKL